MITAASENPASVSLAPCAWPTCDRPARPGSKYCSRLCCCRNADARRRARGRGESTPRDYRRWRPGESAGGQVLLEHVGDGRWRARCACGAEHVIVPCLPRRCRACSSLFAAYVPGRVLAYMTVLESLGKSFYLVRAACCGAESVKTGSLLARTHCNGATACIKCRWKKRPKRRLRCSVCEVVVVSRSANVIRATCRACRRKRDARRSVARRKIARVAARGRVCHSCEATDAERPFETLTECEACYRKAARNGRCERCARPVSTRRQRPRPCVCAA